jgi:hypothetical protein
MLIQAPSVSFCGQQDSAKGSRQEKPGPLTN